MKTLARIAAGLATVGAYVAVAPTAAAQPGTCTVTFQPQNEFSYHAAYQAADGTVTVLIAQQTEAIHLPPTSFDIPADALRVLWSTRPELAPADPSNPANYFPKTPKDNGSSLWLGPDCTFTTPYTSAPNWRPSVVIRPGTPATTTTTSAAPTTTTEPAPSTTLPQPTTTFQTTPHTSTTTTEQPPTGTTSSTVSIPTTTIEVDEPLQPEPTTTAPASPPTVPVPSTTSTTTAVELFTATSVEQATGTLPMTGSAWLVYAFHIAGYLIGVGGAMLALCIPARRRLQRARVQS